MKQGISLKATCAHPPNLRAWTPFPLFCPPPPNQNPDILKYVAFLCSIFATVTCKSFSKGNLLANSFLIYTFKKILEKTSIQMERATTLTARGFGFCEVHSYFKPTFSFDLPGSQIFTLVFQFGDILLTFENGTSL